ncbi:HAD family hydrolase [Actinomadura mexicana]|uniref:Putative hydrolase of the HAD superfamily n=1 Tax=Actinomadura mexicana TaxID=134959 RepID=A0A238YUS8_9ACTN|nr:HAD family phosphatase [Actinomadura mexicana]SNR74199.1 putative hydrolase of the HAD superfamily [Actinomadura mexicana]
MPDVIVFDLYGVIARTQTPEAVRRIEEIAGTPGRAFWDAYWACRPAYDAGQESASYWADVAGMLGATFPDVPALTEADLESWTDVDEEMVALVGELADQGRTLGLLSNIIGDLVPRFEARHGAWLSRFDERVYSCRIGVAKPDPRAYEICAGRLGVKPADVLFFDDNERNVLAARETGMRAELFTSPAQVRTLTT